MYAKFQGLNDPRVPQPASTQLGLTGGNIYTPLTPYSYTGWVPAEQRQGSTSTSISSLRPVWKRSTTLRKRTVRRQLR